MRESLGDRIFSTVNVIILAILGIASLFPFYYVVVVSFTSPSDYTGSSLILYPKSFSLAAYEYIFSTNTFIKSLGVSAYLAIVGTLLSLMVSAAFGYMISRKRLFGRKPLTVALIITILFSPGIIPNYLLIKDLGLMNSLWSIILPGLLSGWNALLLKTFFDGIPESLEESAYIDGANDLRIFFQIILPLSLPALAAFGLFFAVAYWNTFFTAILYITDPDQRPLQVLLQGMLVQSETGIADPSAAAEQSVPPDTIKMAAVVVATVPILLVYPFLQKHFAKGVMLGSVKG
ncbi:carbohydrate ABC transporter permease [Paenibacillus mucilaginosus]|uniref:Binding-protein-dependent transport system inner membrane component n=3 Tax=Paenibacillus mucilaginosus TaxID=61624 RepID=H6NCQ5_9BACL|nr:carbohydrate ABC transporter permease [Paenibacillus mucilaginosus]AEI40355.1 binding-protein-dependent transport system inner membrane component [Paenibacillus mucilaginosus KNP414]AFC28984.1 binding-protein-dependent transport system inner membrane component [Paenibacillus mucilaginosus 3016]AFH61209.1 ABC transporter permease [Paenibacillus mucilaginosus K02]MCG7213287.1 carbohydrate ABC transporter permease [Paenibacillus mucilaginosus]WDM29556.1 carbohydrate ABC transporter permease [P